MLRVGKEQGWHPSVSASLNGVVWAPGSLILVLAQSADIPGWAGCLCEHPTVLFRTVNLPALDTSLTLNYKCLETQH